MIPVMEEARSDAEILARTSKHPELFGVVFDRHFATIHGYLERRVGRDAADELSGEVFRIAFERRSQFRPMHESALPWLYGLTTNLVLKCWRGESRHLCALARLRAGGAKRAPISTVPTPESPRKPFAPSCSKHSQACPRVTATSSSWSRGSSFL
jgi:DNA-directed RNA polymerase specialized sigma24 family protein